MSRYYGHSENILNHVPTHNTQANWSEAYEYPKYNWLSNSTAQLVRLNDNDKIIERFCSGFLIDQSNFLTAGHCVKSYCEFVEEVGIESLGLSFNYQLNRENTPESIYRLKEIAEHGSCIADHIDYAILKTASNSAYKKFGHVNLTKTMREGQSLVTTHHPDAMPKKISFGKLNTIYRKHGFFSHSMDTLPGSSGAPVGNNLFTKKVLGVHVEGGSQENYAVSINEISQHSDKVKRMFS